MAKKIPTRDDFENLPSVAPLAFLTRCLQRAIPYYRGAHLQDINNAINLSQKLTQTKGATLNSAYLNSISVFQDAIVEAAYESSKIVSEIALKTAQITYNISHALKENDPHKSDPLDLAAEGIQKCLSLIPSEDIKNDYRIFEKYITANNLSIHSPIPNSVFPTLENATLLAPEEYERVLKWLQTRCRSLIEQEGCFACGGRDWEVPKNTMLLLAGRTIPGAPLYENVSMICKTCGNTLLFNVSLILNSNEQE